MSAEGARSELRRRLLERFSWTDGHADFATFLADGGALSLIGVDRLRRTRAAKMSRRGADRRDSSRNQVDQRGGPGGLASVSGSRALTISTNGDMVTRRSSRSPSSAMPS